MKIVVRTPNWIGDVLFSLPAVESLRANFPDAEVHLAGPEWLRDLLAGTPWAGGILPLPPSGGHRSRKAAVDRFRSQHFDAGLLLTNSWASAWLLAAAKIPERWGYARDARGTLLTKRVRPPKTAPAPHMVYYYLHLLEGLGLRTLPPEIKLAVGDGERAAARRKLASRGVDPNKKISLLAPGAAYGPAKRWPGPKFAELARLLHDFASAEVVIVGTADDGAFLKDVPGSASDAAVSLAGDTTLRELLAVMSLASVVISNDSGPMHMANALRVPVVGIFGPTDPRVTAPFHPPSTVVKKDGIACWPCLYRTCPVDHRCMTGIAASDVFDAAAPFLK
jgi:lipopolysaccharide heptosyltransferase II